MEERLLERRIADALQIADRRQVPHFVGFLTEEEAARAAAFAGNRGARFCLWGGYDDAERRLFCALPDWCEPDDAPFPITPLTLSARSCDVFSHRDVLGALTALGLARVSIGDIRVEPGRAVAFLLAEVASFAASQLETVGRVGVKCSTGFTPPLPQPATMVPMEDTVASARLDCVVAALARCGRSQAEALIAQGRVSVNALPCEKVSRPVAAGDRITVRGCGKFAVDALEDRTKKGRVILRARKYC